jgi:hypothetical protein
MAQKVFVEMVDDLDGSTGEDVTTVAFALDGRSYEIDLNSANANALRESLAQFVEASRRSRGARAAGRVRTGAAGADSAARERAHAIRQWAEESGHEVSARGRIPSAVVDAYEAAQQGKSAPAAPKAPVEPPVVEEKAEGKTKKSRKKPVLPSFSG